MPIDEANSFFLFWEQQILSVFFFEVFLSLLMLLFFYLSMYQFQFYFTGKQMNDDKFAQDYKISGGSVLHLVLALRYSKLNP